MPEDTTDERQTTNPDDARNADDARVATDDSRDDEYVGEYDKLVRDDIPAVVRDDGNHPVIRTVDGAEYDRYLAAKLVEEATEYVEALDGSDATSEEDALDELADAYAVLHAIVAAGDASMADVRARASEKVATRGGFEDGIVLERIEPSDMGEPRNNDDDTR